MDPISDLLTRIRNSSRVKHEKVDIPFSQLKEGVCGVLKSAGLIQNFKVVRDHKQGMMRIYLKYDEKGNSVISQLQRESRPGRRLYVDMDKIPIVRNGFGISVLSTSKGILSGTEAKEKQVGGELLCTVW